MAIESVLLPGGRTGRIAWWFGTALLAGVGWLAGMLLYGIFGEALFNGITGRLVLLAATLLLVWAAGALAAMRFRDRDLDPAPRVLPVMAVNLAKALLDFLGVTGDTRDPGPLDTVFHLVFVALGLWYVVALGFLRGTDGANRFGEDPAALAGYGSAPGGTDRWR